MRANTVIDDKDLLVKANAEIGRLKILLRQALNNNANGLPRNLIRGSEGGPSNDNSSGNNESNEMSMKLLNLSKNGSDANDNNAEKQSEQNNEVTLQIFEENEKLKKENFKMRQALEWSIKLAKKKKAETEFDNASLEDINRYRQILNSIDLSPSTFGNTMSAQGSTKQGNSRSSNDLPNIHGQDAPNNGNGGGGQPSMSRGVSFIGLGAGNRDMVGFKSPAHERRGSASGGTPLNGERRSSSSGVAAMTSSSERRVSTTISASSIASLGSTMGPSAKKKKKRGKAMSLPALFRTQKELDYLEFLQNTYNQALANNTKDANGKPKSEHCRTPSYIVVIIFDLELRYLFFIYNI